MLFKMNVGLYSKRNLYNNKRSVLSVKRTKGSSFVISIYLYWVVQVFIQNILHITSSSLFSFFPKILLIIFLVVVFIKDAKINIKHLFVWAVFLAYTLIVFFKNETGFESTAVVYYFFPALLSFLIYVAKSDFSISEKDLFLFCKLVLYTVLLFECQAKVLC